MGWSNKKLESKYFLQIAFMFLVQIQNVSFNENDLFQLFFFNVRVIFYKLFLNTIQFLYDVQYCNTFVK